MYRLLIKVDLDEKTALGIIPELGEEVFVTGEETVTSIGPDEWEKQKAEFDRRTKLNEKMKEVDKLLDELFSPEDYE